MTGTRAHINVKGLVDWAEIEMLAVCDVRSSAPEFRLSRRVHADLVALCRNLGRDWRPVEFTPVVDRLNALTTEALLIARSSFCTAVAARVDYDFGFRMSAEEEAELTNFDDLDIQAAPSDEHNRSGSKNPPHVLELLIDGRYPLSSRPEAEFELELGAPALFKRKFDAITAAPLRLRARSPDVQFGLDEVARTFRIARVIAQEFSSTDNPSLEDELRSCEARIASAAQNFDAETVELVRRFEYRMPGCGVSTDPSLPRSLRSRESAQELRDLANRLAALGSMIRFPHLSALRGESEQMQCARDAWIAFESAGRSLRVLAGWVRGLSISQSGRICAICYRHAASRSRCDEHATKTHETREARLGMRIRPSYLKRLKLLTKSVNVRSSLNLNFSKNGTHWDFFTSCARTSGVGLADLVDRFAFLAIFLCDLRDLLNEEQASDVVPLFEVLLEQAVRFGELPSPYTDKERTARAELHAEMWNLISPLGFFRAWFSGRLPEALGSTSTRSRAHDRRHPMAQPDHAGDLVAIRRQLVMQRAWDEAEAAYRSRAMPEPKQIRSLRQEGLSFAEIGDLFDLSHQSVRSVLAKDGTVRSRNRLL